MKVFFDNCTSPRMARTLHAFIEADGHQAVHISDVLGRDVTDIEWMQYLGRDPADWIVFTGDERIRKNKAEARAFAQARLKGIVLAPAYQRTPMSRNCAVLIDRWPKLLETLENFEPPVLFELSINFSGRFRQLSL